MYLFLCSYYCSLVSLLMEHHHSAMLQVYHPTLFGCWVFNISTADIKIKMVLYGEGFFWCTYQIEEKSSCETIHNLYFRQETKKSLFKPSWLRNLIIQHIFIIYLKIETIIILNFISTWPASLIHAYFFAWIIDLFSSSPSSFLGHCCLSSLFMWEQECRHH